MYEWVKALHVVAVTIWMAGMICLPRLFVYHCEAAIGSDKSESLKIMERRVLKAPIAWLAGPYLAWLGHWWTSPGSRSNWHLSWHSPASTDCFSHWVKDFAADRGRKSRLTYRTFSELPIMPLIAVIVLVVVKPF
jgi:putative membrane protein